MLRTHIAVFNGRPVIDVDLLRQFEKRSEIVDSQAARLLCSTPVFDRNGENLLFFNASRGHHADIGGLSPGSTSPAATHITEEGVLIKCFHMVDAGAFQEQALSDLLTSADVSIRRDQKRRRAEVDFTGTSPQQADNFNAPRPVARAVVLYCFRTLVDADIPMNAGCLDPIDVMIPEKSMLSPEYPAAVVAGNTEVSQAVTNALLAALQVNAASQGTMNNFVWGDDHYQNYEITCGGTGAGIDNQGKGFKGADAVHSHMSSTRLTDVEVLETRFPVLLERFEIRRGSGGAGRFRGGDGVTRILKFLQPMEVNLLTGHREVPPIGIKGGQPGACGVNQLRKADGRIETLKSSDRRFVEAGDAIIMHTPGGGGFGRPL